MKILYISLLIIIALANINNIAGAIPLELKTTTNVLAFDSYLDIKENKIADTIPTRKKRGLFNFKKKSKYIQKSYEIAVSDWEYLIPDNIKIECIGITKDKTNHIVMLHYDKSIDNYFLDTSENPDKNMIVHLSKYSTKEVQGLMNYIFNITMLFDKNYTNFKINVIVLEPDISEVDYTNPTKPLVQRYKRTLISQVLEAEEKEKKKKKKSPSQ